MKRFRGIKGMVILVLMMLLIVGYFIYLTNRNPSTEKSEKAVTETQKPDPVTTVLLRDLEKNYPSTPKEVVKYYAELTKVLHNEEYTDAQFQALAAKIQQLYDTELIENKEQEQYLLDLQEEIDTFHTNKWTISTYWTSASTDVERFKENGYEFARLYCTFSIRQGSGNGSGSGSSNEVFLLRKDQDSHWKIYGWKLEKRNLE